MIQFLKVTAKGVTAFIFGMILGFLITFGVPVQAGDGMVTFSTGQKLPTASLNLIVTAFRNGEFYDSSGLGSNYIKLSHNTTDGVITTNTGKVRISAPLGSQVDLETNGADRMTIGDSAITASVALTASSTLGVSGNTHLAGTLTVGGAASFASTIAATGQISTLDNLGIGTATPTASFASNMAHIQGVNGSKSAILRLGAATGKAWEFIQSAANANLSIYNVSAGAIRMYLEEDGDIGIGTYTPASKLHVDGTVTANTGVQLSTSANHNSVLDSYYQTSWTPVIQGTSSAGTGTYTTQVGTYTRIGNVIHFTYNITTTAHTGTGNMVLNLPGTANTTTSVQQTCPPPEFQNMTLPAAQVAGSLLIDPSFSNVAQIRSCPNASGGSCAAVAIDTAMTIKGSCTIITNDL